MKRNLGLRNKMSFGNILKNVQVACIFTTFFLGGGEKLGQTAYFGGLILRLSLKRG